MNSSDWRFNVSVAVCLVLSVVAIAVALASLSKRDEQRSSYLQDILTARPLSMSHLPAGTPPTATNAEHADAQNTLLLFAVPGRKHVRYDQESVLLVDLLFKLQLSNTADPSSSSLLANGDRVDVLVDGESMGGVIVSVDQGTAFVGYKDTVHLSSKQTRNGARFSLDLSGLEVAKKQGLLPSTNVWITSVSESVAQFVVRSRNQLP